MQEFFLLDAILKENNLVIYGVENDKLKTLTLNANYRVYLQIPRPYLDMVERNLLEIDEIQHQVEYWYTPPTYEQQVPLLIIESPNHSLLRKLAQAIIQKTNAIQVNTYPPPLVETLDRNRLWPGYHIRLQNKPPLGNTIEDPRDPLYKPPNLRILYLTAYSWHGPTISIWDKPNYYKVSCCGETILDKDPDKILDTIISVYKPHIVVARLEDHYWIPELKAAHDRRTLLLFDPSRLPIGFHGAVEWMRLSRLPLSMVEKASIGKILTSREALHAYRRKYIIKPRHAKHEKWRTLTNLIQADKAGAGRIPEPGIYWNVYQLDFNSLYPTIISHYNISAETVSKTNCQKKTKPSGAIHPICMDTRGLVSEVLGELVKRRARIKRILKQNNPPVNKELLKERSDAIKWILVSGFGYLGYRNSLFGSIMAYENVTSIARHILRTAEQTAETHGYRLIHSIVDSIFIQPQNPTLTIEELAKTITEKTKIEIRLEAHYIWLIIPPTKKGYGAANKYYGLLEDGTIKMKGIIAIRHNTPPYIANIQKQAINILAQAKTPEQLYTKQQQAKQYIINQLKLLEENKIPPSQLTITIKLHSEEPKTKTWKQALTMLQAKPKTLKYIQTIHGAWPVEKGPPPKTILDTEYYRKLARQVLEEMLLPYETDKSTPKTEIVH